MPPNQPNLLQALAPLSIVGAASHREAQPHVRLEPRPHPLGVELVVAEVDHLGGRAREIQQCLGHLSTTDGLVRAMALGIRLLDERGPQLLLARGRPAAAKGELCLEGEVLAPRLRCDGKEIVNLDGFPLAVHKEAQAAAARPVARGVHEELSNQVVPLRHHGERAHEPAVAHAALPQVLGAESKVIDNVQLGRQARPLEPGGAAVALEGVLAAVDPCEEAALARLAVPVLFALVGRVALHCGFRCDGVAITRGRLARP